VFEIGLIEFEDIRFFPVCCEKVEAGQGIDKRRIDKQSEFNRFYAIFVYTHMELPQLSHLSQIECIFQSMLI